MPEGERFEDVVELLGDVSRAGAITSVAFSPDGTKLAEANGEGFVQVWDLESNRILRRFDGHRGTVWSVAFSPDGETLASGSSDQSVRLWDVSSGRELRNLQGYSSLVLSVAFSPDGETLASASDDQSVRLWDVSSGRELETLQGHSSWVGSVAFSPDGETLASASYDQSVRLWDVSSGRELRTLQGHSAGVFSVAFSPDGETLASASYDQSVRLWDVSSSRELKTLQGHSDWVRSVAFSPDGETLASASFDQSVRLWDVARGRELETLQGHSDGVLSVAFSPDGEKLAAGGQDGLRFWRKSRDEFELTRLQIGGLDGMWIRCNAEGHCLRRDDGTFLQRRDASGLLHPIPPQIDDPPPPLEILSAPTSLTTRDGEALPFTVRVKNTGTTRAFWLNVRRRPPPEPDGILFHPPKTHIRLEPGEEADLECHVSFHSSHEHPVAQAAVLDLELHRARAEPIPLEPISIESEVPNLQAKAMRWMQDGGNWSFAVNVFNTGDQDLEEAELSLELSDLATQLQTIQLPILASKTGLTLTFALPPGYQPAETTQATLHAAKFALPAHRWTFADLKPRMPDPGTIFPGWLGNVLSITAICVLLIGGIFLHPILRKLSRDPESLKTLQPSELPTARRLLIGTRRFQSTLDAAKVQASWLDQAIDFQSATPAARARLLAKRWTLTLDETPDAPIRKLLLPSIFPLNLKELLLHLPEPGDSAADIANFLRSRDDTLDQVTLILSPDAQVQAELHAHADAAANLWVAPTPEQITELLLDADPLAVLARRIAEQVPLVRISPYQTGGGVDAERIFFGRRELLAHVLNREPANYLLVGGRQLGKSSLLKAIERRLEGDPRVDCSYLVLSRQANAHELTTRLARLVDLPSDSPLDTVTTALAASVPSGKRRLVLVDEADSFIARDRADGYSTLFQLRRLSEERRCHFILAGFWELYEAAALDYQSPLKNFGETLTLGALEPDACRALAVEPMATMGLAWHSPDLVDELVRATGRRANLISIACNEIVKSLPPEARGLGEDVLRQALQGIAMDKALEGWKQLTADEAERRLDRLVVYATIGDDASFTHADLLESLERHGERVAPERLQRALDRLELAYVVGREGVEYTYRVPLMVERLRARRPEVLLRGELARNEDQG